MANPNILSNITTGMALSGFGSLISGISIFKESSKQADEIEFQGSLALKETLRDASIIREEGRSFAASQSLQFIGAGVELVGSALITIAQTKAFAEVQAKALEASGRAKSLFALRQAASKRAEGRAALAAGITKATVSVLSAGV